MRIGILGGTFDPIHMGHLILGEEALGQLNLDKIVFVPAYLPPHKPRGSFASSNERYRMVHLATCSNPHFEVSRIELEEKGKSYSIETIKKFKKKYSKAEVFFITGADSLKGLFSWKDIKQIFRLSHFVIAKRLDYPIKNVPKTVKTISIIPVGISSSEIRRRIAKNKSIHYLVPDKVVEYIKRKRLYRRWKR